MAAEVKRLFDYYKTVSVGDTFEIQDSLPFDGRSVSAQVQEEGVYLTEDIDGEPQTVYISHAEIATLMYRLSTRRM